MKKTWLERNVWAYIGCGDIAVERLQCKDEGKDIPPLEKEFDRLEKTDLFTPEAQKDAEALLDKSAALLCLDPELREPSCLEEIKKEYMKVLKLGARIIELPTRRPW